MHHTAGMRFFFASSTSFQRQLTDLYDMIHPTAAAMWNLRWQVAGYVAERGPVGRGELHGRFVAGSGIGSANLERHCIDKSWREQQSELALLALYAGISLYEGWTATLEVTTPQEKNRLQFHSRGTEGRTKPGARDVLDTYRSNPSPAVEKAFGQALRSSSRYMPTRLEDLLLAYRCFKEVRNCSAHAGRIADAYAEDAYRQAQGRVTALGARGGQLSLPRVVDGRPVVVSLTDVQALWAVMLSLVVTLDADLAPTTAGEQALVSRWKAAHGFRMLSGEADKRERQLLRMNSSAGLPRPNDPAALYKLLRGHRLLV